MQFNPVGLQNVGYNPYAAPQQSLIDQNLNQARQVTSQTPFKGFINYADMWFNLRNNPQLPIKLSEELKWQFYFLCGATKDANGDVKFIDPNGKIGSNYFSIDHLKTDDLIMLFRIVFSYMNNNPEPNVPERDMQAFGALFTKIPEKITQLGKESPQAKAEILQKLKAQNDPLFNEHFYAQLENEMKSEDEKTFEMLEQEMAYLIENQYPENVIQAHIAIMECFKSKNPVLNLSRLELDEIPPSVKSLSHIKTVYLNLSSRFYDGTYLNPFSLQIGLLPNLDKIGFSRAPFTEEKLQLHKELNAWCKEVRGKEEYQFRVAVFFQIMRNYESAQTDNPDTFLSLDGRGLSSLPTCLKELTHLERLEVRDCEFAKFPEPVLHLENLRSIQISGRIDYVDDTRVTKCEMKEIPKEIANLTHLERFVVCDTMITTLPPEMASIKTLQEIEVSDNKITYIPNTLASLPWNARITAIGNPLNQEWLGYFKALIETTKRENDELGPRFTHEVEQYGGYDYQPYEPAYPAFQGQQWNNQQFGQHEEEQGFGGYDYQPYEPAYPAFQDEQWNNQQFGQDEEEDFSLNSPVLQYNPHGDNHSDEEGVINEFNFDQLNLRDPDSDHD